MIAKVFCLALCIAGAVATEGWTSCLGDGEGAQINSVTIAGCDRTPCTFVMGNSYDIEVNAISDRVTATLLYKLTVTVGGFPVVIRDGDACDHLTVGSCPTSVGEAFNFLQKLDVTNALPELQTTATATVNDDAGGVALCVKFDIITVRP